ncbi:MAG TPA: Uma2 family endonuclease [Gemmataceae bacterium]|nr:Uma2 family endonuclease [Gemmataceae bacterium]
MRVLARKGSHTFQDFCVLVRDDQKADLIDGIIYMASPENTNANALFVWLTILLGSYIESLDLGQLFGSRVAFRLSNKESPEPDLAVVLKKRLHLIEGGFVNGRPDLAIEIVSPESVERDYVKKRRQYQKAGVPEYWIIDETEEKVTLLRLGSDGKYREERVRGGVLRSQVLPGFWIRPEWLRQRPRQKAMILEQILGRKT